MRDVQRNMHTQQAPSSKKGNKGIIIGVIVSTIAIVGLWMWWSNSGEWVCENGEWIMQGKTKESKPEATCQTKAAATEQQKPDEQMIEADSKKVAEGINIRVMTPHVNATVNSPIEVTGEAKDWYLDDAFFVELIDQYGNVIGEGMANAIEAVDVEEYIAFNAKIKFDQKDVTKGDLVFYKKSTKEQKNNEGTFSFPIFFK